MNTDSKLIHRLRLTMIILFFFILWIPIIQMIHPIFPEIKSTEKRKLAEKPKIKFRFKALKGYVKRYNVYINDHYGLRNFIIRANCMVHVNLLRISPRKGIVLGREGWLYYDNNNDGSNLNDFCGESNFSEANLDKIVGRIREIKKYCDERNILFRIVFAPSKHTIYPEFLPLDIRNRRGSTTRLDQLKNVLIRDKLESVFIDLRPALLFSKRMKPYPLYRLTDTHWNQMGAFIAYTEIMKNLLLRFPRIKVLDINNYNVSQREDRGLGDLTTLISMSGLLKDTDIVLQPQVPYLAKRIDSGIELQETYNITRFHVEKCNYPKLLMFQDSFGVHLVPFLSESFSDSLYIWYMPSRVNLSIIEKERPHVVILEMAERYLEYLLKPLPPASKKVQGKPRPEA